jgi:hypothetical protein
MHASKLENEYQTTTRLSSSMVDDRYLVRPIELISDPKGMTALVFEDDGMPFHKTTSNAKIQVILNFVPWLQATMFTMVNCYQILLRTHDLRLSEIFSTWQCRFVIVWDTFILTKVCRYWNAGLPIHLRSNTPVWRQLSTLVYGPHHSYIRPVPPTFEKYGILRPAALHQNLSFQ